jgi:BirA family biotin operon repressor/biotin-[acetyl-CoA-carboxylase] ligase
MKIIHKHFEVITSTNDWAKRNLKAYSMESLLVVSADTQTAGRGQYGRKWLSPKNENLYVSFGFFLEEEWDSLTLTHLLARSASRQIKEKGLACHLKWPNDLMIAGKKIAGILCETQLFGSVWGIVIGIGLNVNMSLEHLKLIDQPATSLLVESGKIYCLKEEVFKLANTFEADLSKFLKKGPFPFNFNEKGG